MSLELFAAVLTGDSTMTADLLSAGADPNVRRAAQWSGAMEMVAGHPEFAPHLLRTEYSDPNPLIIWTWTPLLLACAQSYWEIAGKLLDAGADADISDERSQTPLLFAICGAQSGLVRRLLARGATPHTATEEGVTPLMTAAALDTGDQPYAFLGLRRMASIYGPAPTELWADYAEILRVLLEHGVDVNAATKEGDTALTFAASQGWTDGVRLLLNAGGRLSCEGQFTGTPLMACLPTYTETARLLIESGADVNALDRWGGSVLTHAIGYWPEERLLASRSSPGQPIVERAPFRFSNPRDFIQTTEDAPAQEDLTALTLLLEAGADPNQACGKEFGTPLNTAATQDAVDSIHRLVEYGADVNGRDSHGRTPLMVAAWQGRPRAVQALLECGADYTLRSHGGNTALMAVSVPGQQERMLRKLDSMPTALQSDPQMEESFQRLAELKEKLGEHGDKIPDIDQMRRFPADIREGMRASLEYEVAKQARNREKVVKILKGAGATE